MDSYGDLTRLHDLGFYSVLTRLNAMGFYFSMTRLRYLGFCFPLTRYTELGFFRFDGSLWGNGFLLPSDFRLT